MSKQMLIIEVIVSVLLLLAMESRADIMTQLSDFASLGQCGANVAQNDKFTQCKEKVTDNWKAETNVKKQTCCKPMAFLDCTLETAKEVCSESDFKKFETTQKNALRFSDTSCMLYRESPSMCGTSALLPVISIIVFSIVAVLRIS